MFSYIYCVCTAVFLMLFRSVSSSLAIFFGSTNLNLLSFPDPVDVIRSTYFMITRVKLEILNA